MKLLPPPTYKNRSQFSNSQDKAYNISVVQYPSWVKTKNDKKTFIMQVQGTTSVQQWAKKNLKQMLKNPKNWDDVMCNHLMNIGFLNAKNYPKLNQSLQPNNDFVFLDYDNKGLNKGDCEYLSYDVALQILQNSGLNYILSTSTSHSENNRDKLHILIPVYKTITSVDEYKAYRLGVHTKLFSIYPVDMNASSNANNKNGGNPKTIKCKVEFSKNDLDLAIDINTKKTLQRMSKLVPISLAPTNLNDKGLIAYGNQVKKMYGYRLSPLSSTKSIRFHRDNNDKGAGVFNVPYVQDYDPYIFFDNNYNNTSKYTEFSTMFSYDDFHKRESAEKLRTSVQGRIEKLAAEFLMGLHHHMYIIANEGAGKSYSVLKLGSYNDFIYVCHTKEKIAETALTLKKLGITYKIVLSVEELLKENGYKNLIPRYKAYAKRVDEPSFREFITLNNLPNKLLLAYDINNKQVLDDCIILMTSAKLKVMMIINQGGIFKDKKSIVFDEFVVNEWYRNSLTDVEQPLYKSIIHSSWNGRSNDKFYVCKEDSFFELLEPKNVMILTTEKRLISTVMYNSDYVEFTKLVSNWKVDKLSYTLNMDDIGKPIEFKLEADNVHYLLVKSTRKEIIVKQIQTIQAQKEGLSVISNGVKGKIDGVLTHMGIKGMNNLSNDDTLIFGTLKNELQIKEFAENNLLYFFRMFKKEIKKSMEIFKNSTDVEFKKVYLQNLIFKYSEPIIQEILLETEVSQSIGRNSGFRENNSDCIVVLPIIQNNTHRRIARNINLNYISENVSVLEYNQDTNEFKSAS